MEASGDQPPKDASSDSGCILQRLIIRPGELPGLHELVRVAGDSVEEVVNIGVKAPRAVIEHVGRLVSSEAEPPNTSD